MRVEFVVSPTIDGWAVSRGRSPINTYETQEAALRVAENLAKAVARQENSAVKFKPVDGAMEEIATFKREGFLTSN